jgi:hypothetical protein
MMESLQLLDEDMRGNEYRKVYFGQMLEWIGRAQVQNAGIEIELKRLDGQGRMTDTIDTGIAIITIVVLFDRATRAVVRCGNLQR